MRTAALAASLLLAPPAARAVQLSSAAISEPYDLLRGTAPPPAELASVPWYPEKLTYEIKWGVFSVGESTLESRRVEWMGTEPVVRVMSEARSNHFCDAFYKVRDLNESWIHARRFHSMGYRKKLREGDFVRDEWTLYDYSRQSFLSKIVNKNGEVRWSTGTVPGHVQDILSSMYYIRAKPLNDGDEIVLDVNTRQNWPLVVKVLKRKRAEVPAGTFSVVVVEPFLRDEGIFVQKGKRMEVWLTDDKRHIPVFMKVEIVFGNVSAYLTKIERP